jgi:hypothetical protein
MRKFLVICVIVLGFAGSISVANAHHKHGCNDSSPVKTNSQEC